MAEADFELIGEATTGLEALSLVRSATPDVAVIDVGMPKMNGIILARKISRRAAVGQGSDPNGLRGRGASEAGAGCGCKRLCRKALRDHDADPGDSCGDHRRDICRSSGRRAVERVGAWRNHYRCGRTKPARAGGPEAHSARLCHQGDRGTHGHRRQVRRNLSDSSQRKAGPEIEGRNCEVRPRPRGGWHSSVVLRAGNVVLQVQPSMKGYRVRNSRTPPLRVARSQSCILRGWSIGHRIGLELTL